MKFGRTSAGGHSVTLEIVEATETLLKAIRTTSLGEKIVSEPHLRAMWNDSTGPERVLIAAVVNALELPK